MRICVYKAAKYIETKSKYFNMTTFYLILRKVREFNETQS